jgi:hypothetical protein
VQLLSNLVMLLILCTTGMSTKVVTRDWSGRCKQRSWQAELTRDRWWFGGEFLFSDNCVIPLAKKLWESEVFGVDCDQLLDYATQNRMRA